jgi:3-methylcrotonyl-CoA carboxylase alpha subunit
LRRALDDYAVLGVTTNLPLLRAIAGHPDFAAGATHTDFLVASGLAGVAFEPQHPPPKVLAAAAIADLDAIGFGGTAVQGVDGGSAAPTGDRRPVIDPWRVGPWQVLRDGIRLRYLVDNQEYLVTATQTSTGWRLEIGEAQHEVTVVVARPNQLVLASGDAGGQRRTERFWIARVGSERLVGWRGASFRLARAAALNVDTLGVRAGGARGHAGLEAPMPGTVIKVLVHEGQEVTAHQPLVVLEAMKMEHVVAAPGAGVVRRLPYGVGALVAKGATLVELEER